MINSDEFTVKPVPSYFKGPPWIFDNYIPPELREIVLNNLGRLHWEFGWKSNPSTDIYSFFHTHLGGSRLPDHSGAAQYGCELEVSARHQSIYSIWEKIDLLCPKQKLVRCYANAHVYGCDGTVHTDSVKDNSYTWIYYPHKVWKPNWAGETVFFEGDEIIASIHPKPNRLIVFPGRMSHVARGVSRTCPVMRHSIMFKTEVPNE